VPTAIRGNPGSMVPTGLRMGTNYPPPPHRTAPIAIRTGPHRARGFWSGVDTIGA